MKRSLVTAVLCLSFIFILASTSVSGDLAGMQVQSNPDNSFDIRADFFQGVYRERGLPTLGPFLVSKQSLGGIYQDVFENVSFSSFEPAGSPRITSTSFVIQGNEMSLELHNNPQASIVISASAANVVDMSLPADVGVVTSGQTALVGKTGFKSEIILRGQGALSQLGQHLKVMMLDGDRCYFRNSIRDQLLGQYISAGKVAGEYYLSKVKLSTRGDLVSYLDFNVSTLSVSKDNVRFKVKGDFAFGKVVIFNLDKFLFTVADDDLEVELDGSPVKKENHLEDILHAREPAYFAVEDAYTLEVMLYFPAFSSHEVIFKSISSRGLSLEVLAVSLGSAFVVLVAAAYMFRRRR